MFSRMLVALTVDLVWSWFGLGWSWVGLGLVLDFDDNSQALLFFVQVIQRMTSHSH